MRTAGVRSTSGLPRSILAWFLTVPTFPGQGCFPGTALRQTVAGIRSAVPTARQLNTVQEPRPAASRGVCTGSLTDVTITLPERQSVDLVGPVSFLEWDGPSTATFVLVHGLGGSSLNWSQVGPGLSGLGRVLALDLPGFGRSPRAGRGSGLMDQRRALSRFTGWRAACFVALENIRAILHAAVDRSLTLWGPGAKMAGHCCEHPVDATSTPLEHPPSL